MTLQEENEKLWGLLDRVVGEVGRTITSELRTDIDAALSQQDDPKCRTCSDVGIIGHSEVCPECADTWGKQAEPACSRAGGWD